jgi:hypothetical protein
LFDGSTWFCLGAGPATERASDCPCGDGYNALLPIPQTERII